MKHLILLLAIFSTTAFGASNKIRNAQIATNAAIAHSKMAALTADRVCVSNGSGAVSASSISTTVLGYIAGLTSDAQTQLDAKQPLDADLTALAALSGTSTIYYRSGAGAWSPVTIGAGLDFTTTPGTLAATGGGGSSVGTGYQKGDGAGGFSEQTTPLPAADLPAPAASAIAATAIDWSTLLKTGGVYTKTLSANTTFTFSNTAVGAIVVRLTNTASNYTVTWPTVKWAGGAAPTMSTGAASDIYTFVYDGTDVYGSYVQESSSGGGGGGATCTTFTPSITNSGAISGESGHYCISGKQLTGWFKYTSGTPDPATLTMTLPNSYDQAFSAVFRAGGCTQSTSISGNIHVLSGSGTSLTFGYETGSSAGLSSVNANGIISNGVTMSCNFSVVVE